MKWRIDLQPNGRGTVEVDGKNISSEVTSLSLLANPGHLPTLVLKLVPSSGLELTGEGALVLQPTLPESDEAEEADEAPPA